MVVLDKKITLPASPPKDWGINPRKHVLSNWRNPIIYGVISAVIWAIAIVAFFNRGDIQAILSKEHQETLTFLVIASVVISSATTFFSWAIAYDRPLQEAYAARHQAFKLWENDVFIPFLEQSYGMTVSKGHGESSVFSSWIAPSARIGDNVIKFRINGVTVDFVDFDKSTNHYVSINPDAFSIDEVIDPAKVSYRQLDPAV